MSATKKQKDAARKVAEIMFESLRRFPLSWQKARIKAIQKIVDDR